MKLDALRTFALTTRPADLLAAFEGLAARAVNGYATFLTYSRETGSLTRTADSFLCDDRSAPGLCSLTGAPVVAGSVEVEWPSDLASWPNRVALPVRRFGSLVGVLVLGSPNLIETGEVEELAEVYALWAEPLEDLTRARQALTQFQTLAVTAVDGSPDERAGHVASVCRLASDLAAYLDFSPQGRERLWTAALHHDLGKVLLVSEGAARIQEEHARAGADFMLAAGLGQELADLVARHHERYDGSGAPARLRGADLTLDQCILSMAEDFVEALALNPHLSFEARVEQFYRDRAPAHHPDVVDALAGLIDSGQLRS